MNIGKPKVRLRLKKLFINMDEIIEKLNKRIDNLQILMLEQGEEMACLKARLHKASQEKEDLYQALNFACAPFWLSTRKKAILDKQLNSK